MVTIDELNECLLYANKIQDLQLEKEDHQKAIVNISDTQEECMQKIKICNYVMLAIAVTAMIMLCGISYSGLMGCISGLVLLTIILVIALFIKYKSKIELKEAKQKENAEIEFHCKEIKNIGDQAVIICREILDKKLLDIIPVAYFYPSAIEFIIYLYNRHLIDSMKEAFVMLEAEIQKSHTLQQQNEFNESLIREIQELTTAVKINTYFSMKD